MYFFLEVTHRAAVEYAEITWIKSRFRSASIKKITSLPVLIGAIFILGAF